MGKPPSSCWFAVIPCAQKVKDVEDCLKQYGRTLLIAVEFATPCTVAPAAPAGVARLKLSCRPFFIRKQPRRGARGTVGLFRANLADFRLSE